MMEFSEEFRAIQHELNPSEDESSMANKEIIPEVIICTPTFNHKHRSTLTPILQVNTPQPLPR